MKTSCIAILFLSSTAVWAQTISPGIQTTVGQPALPPPTAFLAVSRDANSTVWERTAYEPGPNGTAIPRKHRYTELATSLNFNDPQTGLWQPSREAIDLLPPKGEFAAAATNGQCKAWFPLDIAQGFIQLSTIMRHGASQSTNELQASACLEQSNTNVNGLVVIVHKRTGQGIRFQTAKRGWIAILWEYIQRYGG
jgi:hypothetical protein